MNIRSLLIATAAITAVATAAAAQTTGTADVDVQAKFIAPLTITAGQALDFGTATTPSAAGTIVMSAAGVRSFTGGGTMALLATTGNTGQKGTFTVTGAAGQVTTLALSQSVVTDVDYTIDTFTVAADGGDADCGTPTTTSLTLAGTAGVSVACSLAIGATLNFPAGAQGVKDIGQLQAVVTYN